jgi:hypothetical protein
MLAHATTTAIGNKPQGSTIDPEDGMPPSYLQGSSAANYGSRTAQIRVLENILI